MWDQVRIPVGTDICHRGCAYTVLRTVQWPGVYSAAYGTVHYKEPLNSFKIIVGHSPGFDLHDVAVLRRKSIFNRRAGGLVQWLKLPAWKVRYRGFDHLSGLQVLKKQNVSSTLTREDSIL